MTKWLGVWVGGIRSTIALWKGRVVACEAAVVPEDAQQHAGEEAVEGAVGRELVVLTA